MAVGAAAPEVEEDFREAAQDFREARPDSPVEQDLVALVCAAVQHTDLAPAVALVSVQARAMDMAHADMGMAAVVDMPAAVVTVVIMDTEDIMAAAATTVDAAGADGVTDLASALVLAGAGLIMVTAAIPTGMVIPAMVMAITPRSTTRVMTNLPILMEMVPETLISNNNSRNSINNNSRNNNSRSSISNSRNNTSSSHGITRIRIPCRTDLAPMAIRPQVTLEIRHRIMATNNGSKPTGNTPMTAGYG